MSRDRSILDAAADLFFEKGYAAVGVDEIGERAGITGPAVYRHFDNKDEILVALYDEAIDGVIRAISGAFPDSRTELEHRVRGHARYVIDDQKLASVWVREDRSLSDTHRKRLRRREVAYLDTWTNNVQRCFPVLGHDDAARATVMALGTLNSVAHWPSNALNGRGLADSLTQFVLGGLDAIAAPATKKVATRRNR